MERMDNVIRMFNGYDEVNSAKEAVYVFLKGRDAARLFIEQARKEHTDYEGINYDDEGLFFWDNSNGRYYFMNIDTLKRMYKIYKQYIEL